jgi:hypothetical protein
MSRFRRALSTLELKELYLNGRRFTWSNEREHPTLEKLDRVFSTVDWEELYLDAFLSAMSIGPSDHCPLVLSLSPDLHRGSSLTAVSASVVRCSSLTAVSPILDDLRLRCATPLPLLRHVADNQSSVKITQAQ